jgi:hypothetical protein
MTERNWSLSSDHINFLQDASIEKLVQVCKQAHYVDVDVRINGENRRYQADWIKHLRPATESEIPRSELVEQLRYFVAFHTEGELPKEFQGGQLVRRIARCRELLAQNERGE